MSWQERSVMDEKLKFIARYLEGETVTSLSREFGVSRTTGHNLIKKYREMGSEALVAQNRLRKKWGNEVRPIQRLCSSISTNRNY